MQAPRSVTTTGRGKPQPQHVHRVANAHSHQRKSFWVKGLAGASSVVCPCIAVMGVVPSSV